MGSGKVVNPNTKIYHYVAKLRTAYKFKDG